MKPTRFLPGSAEKVEVLRKRASTFLRLWHPLDAKMPPIPECVPEVPRSLVRDGDSEDALAANYQEFLKAVFG